MQIDLDALLDRVDSKYTMVIVVARRARQIVQGGKALVETPTKKPVSIALEELRQEELDWENLKVTWE